MQIYTKLNYSWSDERTRYILDSYESFDYDGPVEQACGASSAQNNVEATQTSLMNQMISQSQTVFGASSSVFNGLMQTFAPIVAAGPSQQGFSSQELSNLNSQAITQTGVSYKNAKAAVGNAEAAAGGGNMPLPSGAAIGTDIGLASSAANETANQLSNITEQNYAAGRQNYQNAVAGEESASNVYNAATGAGSAATGSTEAAGTTANQIATQNNSWVQGVTGALGAIGGAAMTGGMSLLTGAGATQAQNLEV